MNCCLTVLIIMGIFQLLPIFQLISFKYNKPNSCWKKIFLLFFVHTCRYKAFLRKKSVSKIFIKFTSKNCDLVWRGWDYRSTKTIQTLFYSVVWNPPVLFIRARWMHHIGQPCCSCNLWHSFCILMFMLSYLMHC